jgi:hypothetical protein
MATITNLVVAASVNPSGMQSGFAQATNMTQQFASNMSRILNNTIAGTSGTGAAQRGQALAENLLAGMQDTLKARQSQLREQLERGIINDKEFEARGREAAVAFNKGLLGGMDKLRSQGLMTPDMEQAIIGGLEDTAAKGGRSFAQTLTATIHRHRALIPTLGGLLLGQALSSAGDVAGANNGLDKAVEQGKAAEKILENVAMLSSFVLEPIPGLIAAVVGGSAAAIVKIWTNAKEETAKARQAFTNELLGAARGSDFGELAKLRARAYSGDPMAAIEGQRKGESQAAYDARRLGIEGINAAIGRLNRSLKDMPETIFTPSEEQGGALQVANPAIAATKKQIAELSEALAIAGEQAARLDPVMANVLAKGKPGPSELQGFNVAQIKDTVDLMTSSWQRQKEQGIEPAAALVEEMIHAHTRVNELLDNEYDKTSKNAQQLRATRESIDAILRSYTQLGTAKPMNDDVLLGAAHGASEVPARRSLTRSLEEQRSLSSQLASLHEAIKARIEEEGGVLHANLGLIMAQRDIEAQMLANRVLAGPPKPLPSAFSGITGEVDRAQAMSRAAAIAKATGADNAAELERAANAERQKAIAIIKNMIEATDSDTASTKEGRAALEELLQIAEQLGDTTGKSASKFDGLRDAIHGVLDAASGFGKIPQDIRNAATSVEHTIDAFKALEKARKASTESGGKSGMAMLGAGLGVVGGAIGIIGAVSAMFGESPEAAEQKKILRENNDRLRELKFSIDGMLNTASAARRISGNADVLAADAASGAGRGLIGMMEAARKTMQDANAMGAGFDELKEKAKQLGIALFDDKGKLILGAFQQLAEALKLEQERMLSFTKGFDDQSALQDLHDRVFGKTKDADKFNSTLSLLERFAPALAAGLEGIDASTADGRKKIEAALQALVTQLEQGAISLEQYGDLEGAKQLASIIGMLQDSLDGMNNAVNQVTGSLLNVPSWYKVEKQRVAAALPQLPGDSGGSTAPVSAGNPFVPPGSTGRIGSGSTSSPTLVINGDVLVDSRAKSADEMFSDIVRVGRRKAHVKFNNSTRWSELQE